MQKPPDTDQPAATPQKEIIYVQSPFGMPPEEDEINLIDLWMVIWRGKWFIMGFTLLCTLIAVYLSLYILPVTYKSNVVIQPMESDTSAMSKLSGLIGNLPLPISLPGGGNKAENIVAFLNSRNLKTRLITKYDLLPRLYKDLWDEENRRWNVTEAEDTPTLVLALQKGKLEDVFRVDQDKNTSLITVSWVDEEPEFTSKMLNHIVTELKYYLDNEYETDAQREREFVEKQLALATQDLEYWERQVPSQDLTLTKIQRERLASQTVYAELRKQLELAKISEAKELISFKVLDEPFIPEEKFKPKRALICILTIIMAGFFSVFTVFFANFVRNIRREKTGHSL